MANLIDIKVPDIGDFRDVPIIEVLVKPGDQVKTEDPLITLESDKASMEVPSPVDGVVKEVRVKVGDKVSEGSLILVAEAQVAPAGLAPERRSRRAAAPPVRAHRLPTTARPPASTKSSRCESPTSATSRMCRSSRSR